MDIEIWWRMVNNENEWIKWGCDKWIECKGKYII